MKRFTVGLAVSAVAAFSLAGGALAAQEADVKAIARTLVVKEGGGGQFGAANVGRTTAEDVTAEVRCVSRYRSGRCPSIFPYSVGLGDVAPGRIGAAIVPGWSGLVWKRGEYKITVEVSTASPESRFGRMNNTASVEVHCRADGSTSAACVGR